MSVSECKYECVEPKLLSEVCVLSVHLTLHCNPHTSDYSNKCVV